MNWQHKCSHQWATRPDDERFTSLTEMLAHFRQVRSECREVIVGSRRVQAQPEDDNKGLRIIGPNGHPYTPTHWAFGQIAARAEAPAGYLRTLPAPIAADCLNYGLQFKRTADDVGCLLQRNEHDIMRAMTGPRYGRIWNDECLAPLVDKFGDGVTGQWRVPGEFGRAVEITKANATLYASDRDFFIFLADEQHRIQVAGRPNGLARGFYVWNSEVGAQTLGVGLFLFDFACANRIVWGGQDYTEIRLRHTVSAPDRFAEEIEPALLTYAESSALPMEAKIAAAQKAKVERLDAFLDKRFGKHFGMLRPGRPPGRAASSIRIAGLRLSAKSGALSNWQSRLQSRLFAAPLARAASRSAKHSALNQAVRRGSSGIGEQKVRRFAQAKGTQNDRYQTITT